MEDKINSIPTAPNWEQVFYDPVLNPTLPRFTQTAAILKFMQSSNNPAFDDEVHPEVLMNKLETSEGTGGESSATKKRSKYDDDY